MPRSLNGDIYVIFLWKWLPYITFLSQKNVHGEQKQMLKYGDKEESHIFMWNINHKTNLSQQTVTNSL